LPLITQASTWLQDVGVQGDGIIPPDCTGDARSCDIKDFAVLAINISRIILGISGSLALLFFVYGGVMWVLSSGNASMVDKGRKAIVAAVIGIAIIFGSWMIVNFILAVLTQNDPWAAIRSGVTVFGAAWWNPF